MSALIQDEAQFPLFGGADAAPAKGRFSDFVVYVDESGDHSLQSVDNEYPVFVLSFCVFYKAHYIDKVVPALQRFKFNHFGHDLVVLHENEIRKEKGAFKFANRDSKNRFIGQLHDLIDTSNFILISCVVDKASLKARQSELPPNPYHVALGFCLETLDELMHEKSSTVH